MRFEVSSHDPPSIHDDDDDSGMMEMDENETSIGNIDINNNDICYM